MRFATRTCVARGAAACDGNIDGGNRRRHRTTDTVHVGIGLRGAHLDEVLSTHPKIAWFEIHAENYFGGGLALTRLDAIQRDYKVSLHGVGLSIGSAEGLDREHLRRLSTLIRRVDPFLVSEHLAWSVVDQTYLGDLLPLPYTEETLQIVATNVEAAQDALGRRILIENPSTYLRFRHSTIPEAEFLGELARRTGCGILCDVNNIYVSCVNLSLSARAYLDALPPDSISEIHLAGHSRVEQAERTILIDDHGSHVSQPVLNLYRHALARFGPIPTLVEWDTRIPRLPVLLGEASSVEVIARSAHAIRADATC
jgi:uncharacterized protein (UPF0276 family)